MSEKLRRNMQPLVSKAATPVKETFQGGGEERSKKTSILLAPSLHTRARMLAAKEGISVGKVITQALSDYLEKKGM